MGLPSGPRGLHFHLRVRGLVRLQKTLLPSDSKLKAFPGMCTITHATRDAASMSTRLILVGSNQLRPPIGPDEKECTLQAPRARRPPSSLPLQGSLAYGKTLTSLGPPWDPRHGPAVWS